MNIAATQLIHISEDHYIPLADGRQLSTRIWLPQNAEQNPVPAILEYLPYRKRDATALRDDATYTTFATAGYAGVRVDISGTGESDGDFDDEYSSRELADGVEVIEWIAMQNWCNGAVGMMGLSWGGFNSLQIAALQPPALKAVIAIGTTVDRYNDDIHYKNGCLLWANFWWSNVILCYTSRPPDPELMGERWREMWLHRLDTQPFPLENWLAHQRRNNYWQHGSICEDYSAIKIPALVISGWADGYCNAPPAVAAHMKNGKAINGPWGHQYPHLGLPKPRLDFYAEALRWWDCWLRDADNNVDTIPDYRAFIAENVHPNACNESTSGRWIAEQYWPSPSIQTELFFLSSFGQLSSTPAKSAQLSICSPLDCGTACGDFFPAKNGAETSSDQRNDNAGSLCFDTDPLLESVEILGRPQLRLRLAIDKPVGTIIARLIDVHPDGSGHRVSWGVLNLAHRNGNVSPAAMPVNEAVDCQLALDECGYRFLPQHKIRVAISTAYWPMLMPPPEKVTATLTLGKYSLLQLPVRTGGDKIDMPQPKSDSDLMANCSPPKLRQDERRIMRDLQAQETTYSVVSDSGENTIPTHKLRMKIHQSTVYKINWHDPLSARAMCTHDCWMSREDWSIHTVAESTLHCDATHFYIKAHVRAYEGTKLAHERHWEKSIPRDFL